MRKILFLLILATPSFAQIGAKIQSNKIYGVWQSRQSGYEMTLILQENGTGELDGEPIKFTVKSSELFVVSGSHSSRYAFSLTENELKISGGDLDAPVVFKRSGAETSAGVSGQSRIKNGIDNSVVGIWTGNGEIIQFKPDGNCEYAGSLFPYSTSEQHITLTTAQGNLLIPYEVNAGQLIMTINGQRLTYAKQGTISKTATSSLSTRNPADLVGQWCYLNMSNNSQTSRCIKLNADGTYFYSYEGSRSVNTETLYGGTSSQNSDKGTWYVEGDRIFYNSQNSGQGSYRLEKRNHPKNVNDPMIVLDGESYVTMTSRPPWR